MGGERAVRIFCYVYVYLIGIGYYNKKITVGYMSGNLFLKSIMILTTLLLLLATASAKTTYNEFLHSTFDDGSEMSRHIIKDYLTSEECRRRCLHFNEESLRDNFT